MKLHSIRCGICDTWLLASATHCRCCGATRAMRIGSRILYFDAEKLKQGKTLEIVRSVPSDVSLRYLCERG